EQHGMRSVAKGPRDLPGAAPASVMVGRMPHPWIEEVVLVVGRSSMMRTGLGMMLVLFTMGLLAPVLAPYSPIETNLAERLRPPSSAHLLGTDQLGRDQLTRIMYGARVSLVIGLVAVAIAAVVGSGVGLVAGYGGGALDNVIMRLMDAMLAFPPLLLALVIVSALGPGLVNTLIAFGIAGIPYYARLLRSLVLSVRAQEYVLAARALGVPNGRIMLRHVLPNSIAPVIIAMTLQTGTVIVGIASLGYLGLGVQPPTPEWGSMLSGSQIQFFSAPWLLLSPGMMILAAVIGFNLIGDGLRDALDPRLRGSG
ncbi:MAG TPA: ABC transporter permease, partial [Thermomicrobiales bacterium]|nr:ABC transporter permease [Thermomicrobiales bacterium]